MVKNVPSTTSSARAIPDSGRHPIAVQPEVALLRHLEDRLDITRRLAGSTQGARHNMREACDSSSKGDKDNGHTTKALNGATWDGTVSPLDRIEQSPPTRPTSGHPPPFARLGRWSETLASRPSPPEPAVHVRAEGSNMEGPMPKSLFQGYNDVAPAGEGPFNDLMDDLPNTVTMFQRYVDEWYPATTSGRGESLVTHGVPKEKEKDEFKLKSIEEYTQPFCEFLTNNPTVFHTVDHFKNRLGKAGFLELSERKDWSHSIIPGGQYFVSRNGSSLIAFSVGPKYKAGNGIAMIAGHIDSLTAKLKPVSNKKTSAGYVQLGVAPFSGALNSTWWDRDLGIGGRVLVKDQKSGKIITKLVKLGWPIARIPTLAPHFGIGMTGSQNKETEAVPIIGLDNSDLSISEQEGFMNLTLGDPGSFVATQPPKLVRAIATELSITDYSTIVNWELELYDTQPAQTGGLDKEFIFGGRIDDKLCSWAALEALLVSSSPPSGIQDASEDDSIIKLLGVFDDEEIGSLLRQGARGNFLPSTVERIVESSSPQYSANLLSQTYANSFLISADVTHAVNPNFLGSYLENHAPRLNIGPVVCADSNGHMTTDAVSTALVTRVAETNGDKLQLFMIRNDSRSGGTVGPMLSSMTGVRAIDAGIAQLSMHSIRATTGSLDPGLGVKFFSGFFSSFESIDKEFE